MPTVRKLDDLNRIVLPSEVRETLGWRSGTPVDILVNVDQVILSVHEPACRICYARGEELVEIRHGQICRKCLREANRVLRKRRQEAKALAAQAALEQNPAEENSDIPE